MFSLKVTIKGDPKEIQRRLELASQLTAENASRKIAELVRAKIPSGGWYDIYRKAINYFVSKDGRRWAVSGRWEAELSTFAAETTLIEFEGSGAVADVLTQYSPWAIDQIPAISGGYRLTAVARPAAEGDVGARREVLIGARVAILDALKAAGAAPISEFPVINGRVYADIAYMAKALEHGLAGLKRVPHWIVAFNEARNEIGSWTEAERERIQAILDGSATFAPKAPPMPPEMDRALGK